MARPKKNGQLNQAADNAFYEELGKNMAAARSLVGKKNIDMDELAAASGYRRPYLYQAEGGKTIVDPYVLAQYVKATGVDFNFLFRNTIDSQAVNECTLQGLNSNESFESMKETFSKLNADYQEILIRLAAYMLTLQKADGTNH